MLQNTKTKCVVSESLPVKLLPAAILIFAAWVISSRLRGAPAKLLLTGAILLAIASLDSASHYFIAYLLDPRSLTTIIVYSSFIFEALNFVALVLIGIGLIKLSGLAAAKGAPE